MQILEVVLYSKNGQKRIIEFNTGRTNIITGASGTGKSAIIDIIEYCLGRKSCMVPEGIIREKVSWFGLRLKFSSEEMFIGRENPAIGRASTNSAYIEQGDTVLSPNECPTGNTTAEAIVELLTRKIGIFPNLHTPESKQTRLPIEANIKHALFYCFQQQDEIASKRILFHRQSEEFIKFSQKDTLPYFLGAIEEDRLILEQNLIRARRQLKKAEKAYKEVEILRGDGASQATKLLSEANEVGLINLKKYPVELEDQITILENITDWTPVSKTFPGEDKLTQVQSELYELKISINEKSEAIRAAKTFINEADGFFMETQQQEFRLESIHLFSESHTSNDCPLCSNKLSAEIPQIENIKQSLQLVQNNLETTMRDRPRLREYIESIESEKEHLEEFLSNKIKVMEGIYSEQEYAKSIRDMNVRRGKVVGRISLWLESIVLTNDSNKLKKYVENAYEEVRKLEQQIDNDEKAEKLSSILNRIGFQMTEWAKKLKLEHSDDPVRLDLNKLTVVIDKEERPIPLERMGSGENWVGYHLIAHLALHKYFIQHNRPIPRFLILDQPTQVYYPVDKDTDLRGSLDTLKDEDREAVKRMFNLIFTVVEELSPELQIIVMDHADLSDKEFQSAVVEKWRGQNALIPSDW